MEQIMQPWPWWVSGILIGLTVPLLYVLAGKAFGISTSLQQIGAMCAPQSRSDYLRKHDRAGHLWTVVFVIGIALGGFLASRFLSAEPVQLLPSIAILNWPSLLATICFFAGGLAVTWGLGKFLF